MVITQLHERGVKLSRWKGSQPMMCELQGERYDREHWPGAAGVALELKVQFKIGNWWELVGIEELETDHGFL